MDRGLGEGSHKYREDRGMAGDNDGGINRWKYRVMGTQENIKREDGTERR